MKKEILYNFIFKEWILLVSCTGYILTSLYIRRLPHYTASELQVLFILFVLFVVIRGIQQSGIILYISSVIETSNYLPLKLVIITFLLSMIVTNDVALLLMVPLTLAIRINRKDILVIMEVLSANAGSALTPFGNPQNLYIYWIYNLKFWNFIISIASLSLSFLFLLCCLSLAMFYKEPYLNIIPLISKHTDLAMKSFLIHGFLLSIVILSVLHILPIGSLLVVPLYAILFNRRSFHIDYVLLLSFFLFFGMADNLKALIGSAIRNSNHIFLFSTIASQIISNVPATVLISKFTSNWKALLWGSNVGGFGSLFGSLANIIAYRIYITHNDANASISFTSKFLFAECIALFFAVGLYYMINRI